MVFTLTNYRDLGRCSYGTLMDCFDTDLHTIIDNGERVKIEKIEDLFPYLWQSPGIACHSEGKSTAEFHGSGTHWHWDFDESIKKHEKDIEKLRKKIAKDPGSKKVDKWNTELEFLVEHTNNLRNMLIRLDAELEEQKKRLIEENSK
jgi:hypothetical protein